MCFHHKLSLSIITKRYFGGKFNCSIPSSFNKGTDCRAPYVFSDPCLCPILNWFIPVVLNLESSPRPSRHWAMSGDLFLLQPGGRWCSSWLGSSGGGQGRCSTSSEPQAAPRQPDLTPCHMCYGGDVLVSGL